jgi:glycosyltransferase involved in cell wall biosynthesis
MGHYMKQFSPERKVKLLYIITLAERGGAQKHLYYHLRSMDPSLFEVILVTGQCEWLFDQAVSLGIRTICCSSLSRKISLFKDIRAVRELFVLIKSIRPDIVHCHSSKAGILGRFAAKAAGVPIIIFTAHGWAFTDGVGYFKRIFYVLAEKIIAKITTKIITVSEYDRGLAQRYRVASMGKMITIKNGAEVRLNANNGSRNLYRNDLKIMGPAIVVSMVARLASPKDPLKFLELAGLTLQSDVLFLLVGDGPLRSKVEKYQKDHRLNNVRLLGERDDVEKILAMSDVFCLFSDWEGLPLVIIEAMACGLPIVAHPVGGVPELVLDGVNGYLVDKNDMREVAGRLQTLVGNRERRERMGKMSRTRYEEEFSAVQMVETTGKLYKDLITSLRGHA